MLSSSLEVDEFRYTWKIEHSKVDPSTIYVGTYRGLFRSTNGGAFWSSVLNIQGSDVNDILTFDDGSVMAAVEGRGIYLSPSGDPGTFTQLTDPEFPSEFSRIKLAYCATQQQFVYAMFAVDISSAVAPQVYRSNDRGSSWEKKARPEGAPSSSPPWALRGGLRGGIHRQVKSPHGVWGLLVERDVLFSG